MLDSAWSQERHCSCEVFSRWSEDSKLLYERSLFSSVIFSLLRSLAAADGNVKIWNAKTGDHEHTFEAHLAGVSTIAWSPNSDVLASGSDDKTIRLWYTSTVSRTESPTFS